MRYCVLGCLILLWSRRPAVAVVRWFRLALSPPPPKIGLNGESEPREVRYSSGLTRISRSTFTTRQATVLKAECLRKSLGDRQLRVI